MLCWLEMNANWPSDFNTLLVGLNHLSNMTKKNPRTWITFIAYESSTWYQSEYGILLDANFFCSTGQTIHYQNDDCTCMNANVTLLATDLTNSTLPFGKDSRTHLGIYLDIETNFCQRYELQIDLASLGESSTWYQPSSWFEVYPTSLIINGTHYPVSKQILHMYECKLYSSVKDRGIYKWLPWYLIQDY